MERSYELTVVMNCDSLSNRSYRNAVERHWIPVEIDLETTFENLYAYVDEFVSIDTPSELPASVRSTFQPGYLYVCCAIIVLTGPLLNLFDRIINQNIMEKK